MNLKLKSFVVIIMLCSFDIAAFGQYNFSSFDDLNSLAISYYKDNNLDSLILLDEYARVRFPEKDEALTYTLSFLYLKTNQESKALENWDYGLKKGYFFGLMLSRHKDRFKDNPEYLRLEKINKQIGDSLNNCSHLEYELVLPENYSTNKKYPIIFVFHGNNRNLQQSKSIWTSDIVKNKCITVYLQSYIYMSGNLYQWKLNDDKTNKEFKELFEQIAERHAVDKSKVLLLGMSAGGRQAIDYAFNNFLPVHGLILNCPVIPGLNDSSISSFVNNNQKIAIITGENDWALKNQKELINKVDSLGGSSKIKVNTGIGHQFADEFSVQLDTYLNWILE